MKVILFGATGMVGQGVLRECLLDGGVERVTAIVRAPTGQADAKLEELVHADLFDLSPIADRLTGFDACLFCLGVSSAGMTEEAYHRVTYELTIAIAEVLLPRNPSLTFIYVSGAGTDGTERGRSMWARVKGKTENALLRMPFKAVYLFRPGFIQPMHGIKSKTRLYRALYAVGSPIYPVLRRMAPRMVTNTEAVGRAMLEVARRGAPKQHLENRDINELIAIHSAR
jgi:uncharacterized protein YbjT (DUF2867 family)